jgi:hypothetical protein
MENLRHDLIQKAGEEEYWDLRNGRKIHVGIPCLVAQQSHESRRWDDSSAS